MPHRASYIPSSGGVQPRRPARLAGLILMAFVLASLLAGCSSTSNIPDDDHLFVGLTKIAFADNNDKHYRANLEETKEEVEAALATAPNGAIFGSSYYRSPLSFKLWVWNHFAAKESAFAQWMTRSFGKQPVLMSAVNPALRASVATQVLKNHGYLHGHVDYDIIDMRNPKKQKIGYAVTTGPLLTIDSMAYVGFSAEADSLIASTEPAIKTGDAFTVTALDAERTRISDIFRNNGYYYYQPSYAIFLADTINANSPTATAQRLPAEAAAARPWKSWTRFQLAGDLPSEANRQWYIGKVDVSLKKTFMQEMTDSIRRRRFTFRFHGEKPPVRTRVLMANMRVRPGQLYSYDRYLETLGKMNATGLFSMVDMNFTPRDTTVACDTLDVTMNCTFERPYDFYVEGNFMKRTIGRAGPELKVGLVKRNAFRGGEKLDVNLHGSYEWATSSSISSMSAYEYGVDASIEFPRIVAPFFGGNRPSLSRTHTAAPPRRRPRFFSTPTTLLKFSSDVARRPGYYKMHIVSGEWTYRWQPSANSRHEFSPLTVKYQFKNSFTDSLMDRLAESPYLLATMNDQFIPQMRYTYTYSSPSTMPNPIRWETTLSEAGNLVSLGMMAFGKQWNEKDKQLFKNAYSQFVRIETDFTKTWRLSAASQLVGHLSGGLIYSFGNSANAPFSERFYIGGANSVRAFPIRGIGPGASMPLNNAYAYLLQNGDIKLQANLELRHRLFGSLYSAVFLDAGNVWEMKIDYGDDEINSLFTDWLFRFSKAFKQMAVGTGIGLRYDLDFLVLRLDWGIGLHVPYTTTKHGFYNIDHFRDAQTLHFAIGYPF